MSPESRPVKTIVLSCMEGSVFNRSIWEGLARGFTALGHRVLTFADEELPGPESLPAPPDLLLAVHGGALAQSRVASYRSSGIPTAVYLLDEPYEVDRSSEWARWYDWVLSVDRQTIPVHEEWSRALFLPLGYDEERFRAYGKRYRSSILVLGSPFEHRLRLLAPLRKHWGSRMTWVGPGWRRFCPEGQHVEDYVSPEVCARFYRGASIVVNIHRDSYWSHFGETNRRRIAATHLNPRFWEASACGAFQVTSYRSDLERFAPEAITFDDSDQLGESLERHLEDSAAKAETIRALSLRVADHGYRHRCQTIVKKVLTLHSSLPLEREDGRLKSTRQPVDNTREVGHQLKLRSEVAPARKPGELNQGGV